MKILAWYIGPIGIKNKIILKYPYPTDISRMWDPHYIPEKENTCTTVVASRSWHFLLNMRRGPKLPSHKEASADETMNFGRHVTYLQKTKFEMLHDFNGYIGAPKKIVASVSHIWSI